MALLPRLALTKSLLHWAVLALSVELLAAAPLAASAVRWRETLAEGAATASPSVKWTGEAEPAAGWTASLVQPDPQVLSRDLARPVSPLHERAFFSAVPAVPNAS